MIIQVIMNNSTCYNREVAQVMKNKKAVRKSEKQQVYQLESYTLTDLEQIRILADPLRIRILECFCQQERTTKQVADLLGEKPTKLYHHVDALQRVGLIRMTRTQQNRGTLEKYFLSVARRFEADPELFSTSEQSEVKTEDLGSMVSAIFGQASKELSDLIERGETARIKDEGLMGFVALQASKSEILEIQAQLESLLETIAKACDPDASSDSKTPREFYRLTVALFPLSPEKTDS